MYYIPVPLIIALLLLILQFAVKARRHPEKRIDKSKR